MNNKPIKCPFCDAHNLVELKLDQNNENIKFNLTGIDVSTKPSTVLLGTGIPVEVYVCGHCNFVFLKGIPADKLSN